MNALLRLLSSPTRVALLLGVVCTGLVGASFYVQHVLGIEPCPLCIIQRFTYLTLAVVFLVAALVQSGSSLQRGLLWFAALLTLAQASLLIFTGFTLVLGTALLRRPARA